MDGVGLRGVQGGHTCEDWRERESSARGCTRPGSCHLRSDLGCRSLSGSESCTGRRVDGRLLRQHRASGGVESSGLCIGMLLLRRGLSLHAGLQRAVPRLGIQSLLARLLTLSLRSLLELLLRLLLESLQLRVQLLPLVAESICLALHEQLQRTMLLSVLRV